MEQNDFFLESTNDYESQKELNLKFSNCFFLGILAIRLKKKKKKRAMPWDLRLPHTKSKKKL